MLPTNKYCSLTANAGFLQSIKDMKEEAELRANLKGTRPDTRETLNDDQGLKVPLISKADTSEIRQIVFFKNAFGDQVQYTSIFANNQASQVLSLSEVKPEQIST